VGGRGKGREVRDESRRGNVLWIMIVIVGVSKSVNVLRWIMALTPRRQAHVTGHLGVSKQTKEI